MEVLKRVFTSEIRGIDEKEGSLTAYVSTGARDRMDEVLLPEGVDLSKFKKNPVVLWAHNYDMPPIGKALWIKRDGVGLLSKVKFASTAFAQEIFGLYKEGMMQAFSVGFIPKEHEDGDGEKKPRRTYKKWEMLEYSAVPVPANPEALMLAMQKGIISEGTKAMFETKAKEGEGGVEEAEETTTTETEVQLENEPKPEPETDETKSVLMAELKQSKDEVARLKSEVSVLRYKLLFEGKPMKDKEKLSEMTDSEILQKIEEIAVGVIRKITGKVT